MRTRVNNNQGFSIIEVMITLVLGLVILLMVVQLFLNTKNNHAQNDRISETLESGRYALRQLSTDLREAGYLGGIVDTSSVKIDPTLAPPATDCGAAGENNWAYDVDTYRSVQFESSVLAATANSDHTCILTSDFSNGTDGNGTDVLVVKRVYNQPIDPAVGGWTNDTVYLRSNYSTACLWYYSAGSTSPTGTNCPNTGVQDWQFMTHVYYIRSYAKTAGDNIPTLCRKTIGADASGNPTMKDLCLAEGVEKFHVMFGIDTDTPQDGIANEFESKPSLADLRTRLVSARIYVLTRAKYADNTRGSNNQYVFTNKKIYHLGDVQMQVNDHYYRRLYSTTVMLRNPMYAVAFQ